MTPSEVVTQHVNQYSQHHQLQEHELPLLHVGKTGKTEKKWKKMSEVEILYNLKTSHYYRNNRTDTKFSYKVAVIKSSLCRSEDDINHMQRENDTFMIK